VVNIEKENVVFKSVRVRIPLDRAFSLFVERMDTWWPAVHHLGAQPFHAIVIEPRRGGRWYERDAQGNECDWGRVLAWEPPHRLSLSWHLGPDWKHNPDLAKASEVAIRFIEEGPSITRVELEHSGFERHGEGYETLRDAMNQPDAWAATLAAFAKAADVR
jgi:uncharacterized protein YndB with AHSA1/START domain